MEHAYANESVAPETKISLISHSHRNPKLKGESAGGSVLQTTSRRHVSSIRELKLIGLLTGSQSFILIDILLTEVSLYESQGVLVYLCEGKRRGEY